MWDLGAPSGSIQLRFLTSPSNRAFQPPQTAPWASGPTVTSGHLFRWLLRLRQFSLPDPGLLGDRGLINVNTFNAYRGKDHDKNCAFLSGTLYIIGASNDATKAKFG